MASQHPPEALHPMLPFAQAIADPARIDRQLDRLAARADARRLEHLVQEGVRFAQLLQERERVVKLVSRAMLDASYRPSPARLGRGAIGGKEREIARLGALDLVVHGAIADALSERLEPLLSSAVYSYRRGRSSWQAARWLGHQVRAHRDARPDPRTRGLYVLRGDVQSYTDSIPLSDGAPLWAELFAAMGLAVDAPHAAMIRAMLQPPIVALDGAIAPRERGLLFGAPTTNVIANLYAMPLDRALGDLGGAYVRFGDDVLYAHESPENVRGARAALESTLTARGLRANPKKLRVFYWNGAARPSSEWPEASGTAAITFLGASIGFDGTIALPAVRWSAMLHQLRTRIRRVGHLTIDESPESRARLLASIVNDAFDVRSPLSLSHASIVADLISDRKQLAQLDYLLARWIAETATESRGPRALRTIRYRWLRRDARLVSRVVARNG